MALTENNVLSAIRKALEEKITVIYDNEGDIYEIFLLTDKSNESFEAEYIDIDNTFITIIVSVGQIHYGHKYQG